MAQLEAIIPVKDRGELQQCVESLLAAIAITKITICDGGSSDLECLNYLHEIAKNDRICVLRLQQEGFNKSKLLNYAIACSSNELLLISDADIIWNQAALNVVTSTVNVSTICCVAEVEESQPSTVALTRDRYTYNISIDSDRALVEIIPWSQVEQFRPGCGLICASRNTLISLGGYKEIFTGWGWEDQDLLMRAKLLGIKVEVAGKVIHLSHSDAIRNRYCNNLEPSQTRNDNIITCLKSLSQGILSGDLQVKVPQLLKPYILDVRLPIL
ncbi:glycosyltransferase family 2 protein [Aliterella atlantica]|uniref:4,4'-diaponeurosporenoate glycosyltransferase n=1 Tax=Aliterella atlantica CENA595 TaxID=1618023 RepID=A0A0D9A1N9_9CYAN|nr:glycosyltransferase [Aliterella atlantica]KJH73376.1 hypothetical protein UH38_00925 [Aliterella atlantica CENA595]